MTRGIENSLGFSTCGGLSSRRRRRRARGQTARYQPCQRAVRSGKTLPRCGALFQPARSGRFHMTFRCRCAAALFRASPAGRQFRAFILGPRYFARLPRFSGVCHFQAANSRAGEKRRWARSSREFSDARCDTTPRHARDAADASARMTDMMVGRERDSTSCSCPPHFRRRKKARKRRYQRHTAFLLDGALAMRCFIILRARHRRDDCFHAASHYQEAAERLASEAPEICLAAARAAPRRAFTMPRSGR